MFNLDHKIHPHSPLTSHCPCWTQAECPYAKQEGRSILVFFFNLGIFPIYKGNAVLEMGPKPVYDNAVGYRPSPHDSVTVPESAYHPNFSGVSNRDAQTSNRLFPSDQNWPIWGLGDSSAEQSCSFRGSSSAPRTHSVSYNCPEPQLQGSQCPLLAFKDTWIHICINTLKTKKIQNLFLKWTTLYSILLSGKSRFQNWIIMVLRRHGKNLRNYVNYSWFSLWGRGIGKNASFSFFYSRYFNGHRLFLQLDGRVWGIELFTMAKTWNHHTCQ